MLVATMLDRVRAETLAWVTNPDPAWYDSVSIGSFSYWLTIEEARELSEAIAGVVADYKRRSDDRSAEACRVRVAYAVVPVESTPVDNGIEAAGSGLGSDLGSTADQPPNPVDPPS